MNENHDPANGQFSDGGGSSPRGLASRAKSALKDVHGKMDKIREKIHSTRVYHELAVKDRFTNTVPPGSRRDEIVKQSAMFAKAGLEKMAVVAAGGGAIGVAAVTVHSYAGWGRHMAKQYGPAFNASKVGQRLSGLRDRVSNSMRMDIGMR